MEEEKEYKEEEIGSGQKTHSSNTTLTAFL